MENKHTGTIWCFFILMFITTFGSTTGALTQQGLSYDAATVRGFLLTLANIGLVSLIMMAVPMIYRFVRKKKLPYKKGKRICLWNSILLFFILNIISISLTESAFVGGIGALFFYFINKWTFVEEPLSKSSPQEASTSQSASSSSPSTSEQPIHLCLSNEGEKPFKTSINDVYGSNMRVVSKSEMPPIKENPQNTHHKVKPMQVQPVQPPVPSQKRVKYCSRCGKLIDPDTKKCQGCGKQYFKGISIKKGAPLILLFLATASMVCCLCLFVRIELQGEQILEQKKEIVLYKKDISDLEEQVKELEKDKNTWYNYWKRNYKKVDFFDEHVVLVEDDGTGLYHKYDCSKFKGNYFWAYNKEAADDRGYRPCPDCHK